MENFTGRKLGTISYDEEKNELTEHITKVEKDMKDNIKTIKTFVILTWAYMIITGSAVAYYDNKDHNEVIEHLDRIEQSIKPLQEITVRRKGTIATDYNNPGAIRPGNKEIDNLAIGYGEARYGKYLVFDCPEDGYLAIELWIKSRPNLTLKQAINIYAPKIDFNNPTIYVKDICSKLGCKPSTKLKDINTMGLMGIISRLEGFKA